MRVLGPLLGNTQFLRPRVVQISLKESLAETAIICLQGGSFNTRRGFFAVSPKNGFLAYELTRTDTPFDKPYDRDNLTGSYTILE